MLHHLGLIQRHMHVHKCIHHAQVTLLSSELKVFFPLTQCKWTKCTSGAFSTWQDAMKHLQDHLHHNNPLNHCKWDRCSDDLGDNHIHHMGYTHMWMPRWNGVTSVAIGEIFLPCVLSILHHSEPIVHRFLDCVGDGADWNDHCIAHFKDLFEVYINHGEYKSGWE